MKNMQEIKIKKIQSWIIFALIILNIIAFIILSNNVYFRLDLTKGQKYSVSKATVDLLSKLDNTLIIEYYYNDKSKEVSQIAQTIQYVEDMLSEYERASNKVNKIIKKINIDKEQVALAELQEQGIQPFSLSESGNSESKSLLGLSGIIIKYKDAKQVIPAVYSDVGFEYTLDVEIKKALGDTNNKIGIINASTNKTLDKDYATIAQYINNENKDMKIIESGNKIPDDVSTLVILGGDTLTDYDCFQLDQFLMNGGKAFIALGGLSIMFQQNQIFAFPVPNKLNELLSSYGIKVNKNLIGDNDSFNALPQRTENQVIKNRYPIWPRIKSDNFNQKHPAVNNIDSLNLFWTSSITIDEKIKNSVEPLFHTTKASWEETSDFKLDLETYKYPIQEGKNEFTIAYSFNGKLDSFYKNKEIPKNEVSKEQFIGTKIDSGSTKLVVVGCEYFLQNNFISENELYFTLNSIDWMSKDNSLIEIRTKGKFSQPLDKARNQPEFDFNKSLIIGLTTILIPIIFIILAILINLRRKFKNNKLKTEFSKNKNLTDKDGGK